MFLLSDISVGYFVSQDCAFLDKLKQGKKDIKHRLNKKTGTPKYACN